MDERPDPDKLLKRVQAEEEAAGRGRLKLFFGASPGVGKTYAMLEAARQRKKEGWDVVVGLVETQDLGAWHQGGLFNRHDRQIKSIEFRKLPRFVVFRGQGGEVRQFQAGSGLQESFSS